MDTKNNIKKIIIDLFMIAVTDNTVNIQMLIKKVYD